MNIERLTSEQKKLGYEVLCLIGVVQPPKMIGDIDTYNSVGEWEKIAHCGNCRYEQGRIYRKKIVEQPRYELRLVSNAYLEITIGYSIHKRCIGYVTPTGYIYVCNNDDQILAYNDWEQHGMKMEQNTTKWRGEWYTVNDAGILVNTNLEYKNGCVYNIKRLYGCCGCVDANIQTIGRINRVLCNYGG